MKNKNIINNKIIYNIFELTKKIKIKILNYYYFNNIKKHNI